MKHVTSIEPASFWGDRVAGPALRRDERGAVLVVGLALGAVLVAAIAELVALGGVVRAREAAQAVADASALENAIWHARGMNTAAALNVVMGSASAVLVLWRLMLAASTLARLASLVALPLGANAPTALTTSPLAPLLQADAGVEQRVRAMVVGLAAAQSSVARYTPLLAARSAADLARRAGSAEPVESFSASGWAASDAAPAPRLASPISLPLEADPTSLLCAQPAPGWHERVSAALQRVRAGAATASRVEPRTLAALGLEERAEPSTLVVRWAGLAEQMAPGVFCAPAAPAFDGLARDRGALAALERRRIERGAAPASDVEHALQTLARPSGDTLSAAARVWHPAHNGSVYLRSAAQLSSGVIAHAEMYFDCAASWERCAADAAWQPRWRARLRRVRALSQLLAAANDTASAWRPGRALPPAEPAPIGATLPSLRRGAGRDALLQALEDAAAESRLLH
jgi:hypothetical protein